MFLPRIVAALPVLIAAGLIGLTLALCSAGVWDCWFIHPS